MDGGDRWDGKFYELSLPRQDPEIVLLGRASTFSFVTALYCAPAITRMQSFAIQFEMGFRPF